MDGLILDTEPVYRMTWQQAASEYGYSMSDEFYSGFIGRRTADCTEILFETYGRDFPLSAFLERGDQLYQEHFKNNGIQTKPGLFELLDFLDSSHIPKAVATSTGRADALLCLGHLASRFTHIVTGDEVYLGKPAPDIFLLAAGRLRLAPQQCLVLEDADAGAQAAYAAGMPVIIVPDLKPASAETVEKAACVCTSLYEVKEVLTEL
jgi:HAD superfamily hydrolase (TIGR01509 family)